MRKTNQNKGITLIALVITIIVMLILVGVSISMAVNGGLFGYAGRAVGDTQTEKNKEEAISKGGIEVDGVWYSSLDDYLKRGLTMKNYNETDKDKNNNDVLTANAYWIDTDGEGNEIARAVVPKGFKIIPGLNGTTKIADGLVIQDAEGNEFVWIPVEVKDTDTETSIASFYRSDWTANSTTGGDRTELSEDHKEPYEAGYSDGNGKQEKEDYYNMLKSVYINKGFYIGRYEAGSTTERTNESGTTELVVKKNAYPYNYVAWGVSLDDAYSKGWYGKSSPYYFSGFYSSSVVIDPVASGFGAAALSRNMYEYKDVGVYSTLCYGVMWDTMLEFIKDSAHKVVNDKTWGNSTPNMNNTGTNDNYSAKNIYDVAGNLCEWTMEAGGSNRVIRGSSYAADRGYGYAFPTECGARVGFRPALYITYDSKGDAPEEPEETILGNNGEEFSQPKTKHTKIVQQSEDKTITYEAWVPKGFSVGVSDGINKIETGLVIRDKNGNEFVWIPVTTELDTSYSKAPTALTGIWNDSTLSTKPAYDSQEILTELYGNKFKYPDDFQYEAEYKIMVNQVNKFHGFYIGRYETTIDSSGKIGSKYNTPVLQGDNKIAGTNYKYRWYGLYCAQKNANVTGNGEENGVQSAMIYGILWNKTMDFIKTQKNLNLTQYDVTKGKYEWKKDSIMNAGMANPKTNDTDGDVALNISNLASNVTEYTQENLGDSARKVRGGDAISSIGASDYKDDIAGRPTNANSYYGSRLELHLLGDVPEE